ncbi:hypothetical protein [Streptomyces sp. Ac-502]|uniref:hypothetical protein n=1 Tax=Streptomyces sp. Ac-502 TaxID=3342801 RepID=UPI003862A5BB
MPQGTDCTHAHGGRTLSRALIANLSKCPSLSAESPVPLPDPVLGNIEGMPVTGRETDGRLSLLLVSDGNKSGKQVTWLCQLSIRMPT